MPYKEPTPDQERRVREAFMRVLDEAVLPYEMGQLELFPDEVEAFIRQEVERKLYEPKLPNAGNRERATVERLHRLSEDREWAGAWRARQVAQAWGQMLARNPRNPGRYYYRRPLSPRADKTEFEWLMDIKKAAEITKEWEKKWFCELLLEGMPEGVLDFKMECLFLLRDSQGDVTRLVRLKNMLGETSHGLEVGACVVLDSKSFAAPEKFREWGLRCGNFNWSGNQTQLHWLQEDIARQGAWRVVNLVDRVGWFEVVARRGGDTAPHQERPSPEPGDQEPPKTAQETPRARLQRGIWFYGDCAYTWDGQVLMPDSDGIIWHEGQGYYPARRGREMEFKQGRPLMRPRVSVAEELKGSDFKGPAALPALPGKEAAALSRDAARSVEWLRGYWREVCHRMYETIGGYEAWLGMGGMLAFAAAPEAFKEHGCFPGLFVHGQFQSGKTKTTGWYMAMQGYLGPGMGIVQTTSAVGMLQQAENYSNLAVWLDEFREHLVDAAKLAILRNGFDRQSQGKWTPDGLQRTMRTAFVVSGESTSSDAATRSRYPHIQVSETKRLVNHFHWLQNERQHFYLFWRFVMENRPEYVELFTGFLQQWTSSPRLASVSERERLVYGTDYAGWMAMVALLQSHDLEETKGFRDWMMTYSTAQGLDVSSEANVNVFWTDLLTAFGAGEIPVEYFKVEKESPGLPPGVTGDAEGKSIQHGWISYRLYWKPEAVIADLQKYLRQRGQTVALNRKDLRDQLSKTAYWIEGPLRKWFGAGAATVICWGIYVDKHPLGYRLCTDEAVAEYKADPSLGDPRKGPLYAIVEAVENREAGKE